MTRVPALSTLVLDTAAGQLVAADVFLGLDQHNLDDASRRWRKAIRERTRRAHLCQRDAVDEDAEWDWRGRYARYREQDGLQPSYVLEVGGSTEGLLYLRVGPPHTCRLPEQQSLPLVYGYQLATAPWNRPHPDGVAPKYRGVGRALLAQAVLHSRAAGWGGRIGLHSLPGAAAFYSHMLMIPLGPDPAKDYLPYFETTPECALQILARTGLGSLQ